MAAIEREARSLKVAWVVATWAEARGYCFARNERIAEETGLAPNKVRDALTDLQRLGAILIRWVRAPSGAQERRIYLSIKIVGAGEMTGGWIGPKPANVDPDTGVTFPSLQEIDGSNSDPDTGVNSDPDTGATEQEITRGARASKSTERLKAWRADNRRAMT
jgi:Helix-turn-helix domain